MKVGDLVYLTEWEKLGIIIEVQPANFMPGIVEVKSFCGWVGVVWEDDVELLNEAG